MAKYNCEICNKEFSASPSDHRIFCSLECRGKWTSILMKGKKRIKNSGRKCHGVVIDKKCKKCGILLPPHYSLRPKTYCSEKCQNDRGDKFIIYHGKKIYPSNKSYREGKCHYCGKHIITVSKGKNMFCNKDCSLKHLIMQIKDRFSSSKYFIPKVKNGRQKKVSLNNKNLKIGFCAQCNKEIIKVTKSNTIFCNKKCFDLWNKIVKNTCNICGDKIYRNNAKEDRLCNKCKRASSFLKYKIKGRDGCNFKERLSSKITTKKIDLILTIRKYQEIKDGLTNY